MNESKATRYQRLRRRAEAAGVASGVLMLGLVALTPASRWLANWSRDVGRGLTGIPREAVALVSFVFLAVVLWEVVALPAVLYLGLTVDRRFRAAERTVEGVLGAQAHATLIGLPAALFAATIVVVSVHVAGRWWWVLAGAMLALVLVAAMRAAPGLFLLIADTRAVSREGLSARLAALARRAGVAIDRVDEWRVDADARATAMVTGVGRTRRVFVASPLLRDLADDEVEVIVAHELAHHAHHDLWRAAALDAVVLSLALGASHLVVLACAPSLGLEGPADLRALPLIAVVAGGVWLLATPLRLAQSRAHEARADRFALSLTGGVEPFQRAVRRLSAHYLVEDRPSTLTRWLYYRHPTVAERLAAAEEYRISGQASRRR